VNTVMNFLAPSDVAKLLSSRTTVCYSRTDQLYTSVCPIVRLVCFMFSLLLLKILNLICDRNSEVRAIYISYKD
jgi:hypothetical protein